MENKEAADPYYGRNPLARLAMSYTRIEPLHMPDKS